MKRGDLLVAYPDDRPCRRVYINVTRVARNESWADIQCRTWAVMWTKRQPLFDGAFHANARTVPYQWDETDLAVQETDHMAWLREAGRVA